MKKEITADEKLLLFALFAMAKSHYDEMRKFEVELSNRLDGDDGYAECISDAIYEDGKDARQAFETGLKKQGIKVTAPGTASK